MRHELTDNYLEFPCLGEEWAPRWSDRVRLLEDGDSSTLLAVSRSFPSRN